MICSKCQHEKPEKRFATFRNRKGELRRRGICWDCRGQYAEENRERLEAYRRDYNRQNRSAKAQRDAERKAESRAYVDQIKAQSPCADCGHRFPPVCMDFDHIDGAKVMDVARMVGSAYRLELIKLEIEKCEVVCACCHRLRTQARKQNLAPHTSVVK